MCGAALAEAGLDVHEQIVAGPFGPGANVIGRIRGSSASARTWVCGAHYDTVRGSPGADDNGVAVAAVLEIARSLGRTRPRDAIELVLWDMEELQTLRAGALLGSAAMARDMAGKRVDVAGVVDLEMIGCCRREPGSQTFPAGFRLLFPDASRRVAAAGARGDFLALVHDRRAAVWAPVVEKSLQDNGIDAVLLEVHGARKLAHALYRSDHAPFWAHGFAAAMLTDTANFRNAHYHGPGDVAATVDLDFAARTTSAVVAALAELADVR